MAIPVEMPKMSDTMEEGVVAAWMAEEGQEVAAGDVIAQVETDKATMDLEVYDDGVLLKRVVEEGAAVPIGGLIAVLGSKGEDVSDLLARYAGSGDGAVAAAKPVDAGTEPSQEEPVPEVSVGSAEAPSTEQTAVKRSSAETRALKRPDQTGRLKSSPLARKLADDHGIDLAAVTGTGPEGRIVKKDIEARIGAPSLETGEAPTERGATRSPSSQTFLDGGYEVVAISQMRKAISRRLAESKFTSPHFYLTADLSMERAVAARKQMNEITEEQGLARVSFNDLITKACAHALREHRWVNASYMEQEGEVRLHNDVHVAVAVAIEDGLITPVIRHADQKGLSQIAAETKELAERARAKQLQPEEYSGSTFTTSNLGMFGIDDFTAIINPPNACILAIGTIRDVPVVEDGEVVAGKRMKITLSCDHRVVDGASGARFLATVRNYIEDPITLLL
ncbi:MAG: pyruvate dehydrogenase complex dihydrolipoamide acetyltransferase [Rhodothermia bacterium]|nr:MAG: pyruvate dehydrogenase complex dihydrolipoamide acetyltransferase [Rhodothermia bacterium]